MKADQDEAGLPPQLQTGNQNAFRSKADCLRQFTGIGNHFLRGALQEVSAPSLANTAPPGQPQPRSCLGASGCLPVLAPTLREQAAGSKRGRKAADGMRDSDQEPQQHREDREEPVKRHLMCASTAIAPNCCVDFELPYNEDIKALLNTLDFVHWVPPKRVWRTKACDQDAVLSALHRLPSVQLRVEAIHDVPLRVLKVASKREDLSDRFADIPDSLQTSLMKFQQEGVRFALQRGTRVLLGDEMGLGKTVQAIALLAAHKDAWPALIVTPSSLREQWADALHQWLGVTDRQMKIVTTSKDADLVRVFFPSGQKATRDFLIVSYNLVSKMTDILADASFEFVILDESHSIKDPKTQRAKDVVPLVEKARHAVLLSGTPMVSRPKEMLTQLSALVPEAKLRITDFGNRYCLSTNQRFGKYEGCCNHEELNKLLTSTVMVRRLKKDVLAQLPPKRRQQVFLSLEKEQKDKLDRQTAAMDAARSLAALSNSDAMAAGMRQLIMDLYRLTAEVKVKAVQQYLSDLLDGDQKFIVFCHHKVMNDGIAEVLNKKKVGHICIDGSVPADKRQGLVNKFQEQPKIRVALLSIKAAGVGLTLTAASMVVFAELAWSPGDITQAEDRAHRIGQPSSVNVYFLHVKQSVDDIMWGIIQSKLENVGQAINGAKESFEMTVRSEHRGVNQGSLRGFLHGPSDTAAVAAAGQGAAIDPGQLAVGQPVVSGGSLRGGQGHKQTGLLSFFKSKP